MSLNAEFRQALIDLDVATLRGIWRRVAPHHPQTGDDADLIKTAHLTRTGAKSIPFKHRAYSHRWLTERDLPSGLPDKLRPRAERLYPQIVEAVGISCKSTSEALQPAMGIVRSAMEDAVKEAFAEKKTDPVFVKQRMMQARQKTLKKLFGR